MADKATPTTEAGISTADIRRMCGDVPDWKVSAIAALLPTAADVEAAVQWADNIDTTPRSHFLEGKSAQILDILMSDEEAEDVR